MKNVLLIAGGGTLGTHAAKELLRLGHKVTVICLEEKTSDTVHRALCIQEEIHGIQNRFYR